MEYKKNEKTRQINMWIEAGILCMNLTPNRYSALVPPTVYVSNDATIPVKQNLRIGARI